MFYADPMPTRKASDTQNTLPSFLTKRVDNYYRERAVNPIVGDHLLRGSIPGANAIMLVSNDYLDLSGHPYIVRTQVESLERQGNGLLHSSVFTFSEHAQRSVERRLAGWAEAEDALLCQSGWCANTGLVQSIAHAGTPVYVDLYAHMSLWEGIKSAEAKPRPFRHNNPDALERLVKRYGAGVILVDAVYSTDGSVCPLQKVADIAERYGCVLVVDESHSLGLCGENGAGLVVSLGLADKVHFRTASLSKAFAGRGGVIIGSARIVEYIRYEALPAIFSSCLLPHEIAGFAATLDAIQGADNRRARLQTISDRMRGELLDLGYPVETSRSQIIPLIAGSEHQTMVLRDALEKRGIFGSPFCAPATPQNRARIRMSLNCGLTDAQVERIIVVCAAIRREVGLERWPDNAGHKEDRAPQAGVLDGLSLAG